MKKRDYDVYLRVRGIEMYSTVMALVESNPEIQVMKSEMVLAEPRELKKGITRHKSDKTFDKCYFEYLCALSPRPTTVTTPMAEEWCTSNNYAKSSATSMCSIMVKRGMLSKIEGQRSIWRVLYPKD